MELQINKYKHSLLRTLTTIKWLSCTSVAIIESEKEQFAKPSSFLFSTCCYQNKQEGNINTAIYVRIGLPYYIRPPVPSNCETIFSCAVVITICESVSWNCASVYLPKGPDDWLKTINTTNEKWLVGGDFNSHFPQILHQIVVGQHTRTPWEVIIFL